MPVSAKWNQEPAPTEVQSQPGSFKGSQVEARLTGRPAVAAEPCIHKQAKIKQLMQQISDEECLSCASASGMSVLGSADVKTEGDSLTDLSRCSL